MSNPLIIGDGLLGTEIKRQTCLNYISRKKDVFDFVDISSYKKHLDDYDQILNCVAYTRTYSDERQKHWDTNFLAVCDLADYCSATDKKIIIYIDGLCLLLFQRERFRRGCAGPL